MAQYLVHQSISWELISISTNDIPIDLASISTHHHLTNCFMPEGWLSSCKISTLHTWWLLHFYYLKQICTFCAISPYWNDTCRLIHFSWQAINSLSYNAQHWQPYALLAFYFTILVASTGKKTVPRQKIIYLQFEPYQWLNETHFFFFFYICLWEIQSNDLITDRKPEICFDLGCFERLQLLNMESFYMV